MTEKYRPVRDIQASPEHKGRITQRGPVGVKAFITVLSALVFIFSGLGYASIGRVGNSVASAGNLTLGGGQDVKGQSPDGATDILLVGSDSRTDAQGNPLSEEELATLRAGVEEGEHNTDTIMVIRVPNDGSSATAVSIPRDTYISEDNFGNMKINGVFAEYYNSRAAELQAEGETDSRAIDKAATSAGRDGLIRAVSELTGIEVDHYAEVGLLGFVLLTDAIGGVDVCLAEPVDDPYSGANFPAGVQTLDGVDALAFVRQRHGLPRGDLDRVVRQQAFMASMVNKVLSAGTLTSPSRLADMGQAVERSVVIDEGWDIMSFATQLSNLAAGSVSFNTIPVTSIDGTGDYGESIVTVNPADVQAYMTDLLDGNDAAEQEAEEEAQSAAADNDDDGQASTAAGPVTDDEIHVLNAGGLSGLAGAVGGWLTANGYQVAEIANALPDVYTGSQVVAADAADPAAQQLAEALGGLPITTNDSLDDTTLIVVTGADYAGPQGEFQGTADGSDSSSGTAGTVGQPGADFGSAEAAPEINAGGNGLLCVN